MELQTLKLLLWEYLPENLDLNQYDFIKMEKDDDLDKYHPYLWKIDLYFEEKNILPDEYKNNKNIISKGFYEYKAISDFLIRHKLWILNIKKRKWYDTKSKKVITSKNTPRRKYSWGVETKGIKTAADNVFFYKEHMKIKGFL
jgi:hypothetical protein